MPTGYTDRLLSGKDKTLKDFVLTCARSFAPCIGTDDSLDIKIPEEFKIDSYFEEQFLKSKNELEQFLLLDNEQITAKFFNDLNKQILTIQDIIRDNEKNNDIIKNMMELVSEWIPPSKQYDNLKLFVLDQLSMSIESNKWFEDRINELKIRQENFDLDSYYNETIKQLNKNLRDNHERWGEELSRISYNNRWIKQLRKSL